MPASDGALTSQTASPPSILAVACSFLDIDELVELCRKVYFCTDTISHASFIIVNGSLYYLCMEQAFLSKDAAVKAEYEQYQRMCQVNLETALASLPLMLPAKAESIEALLVAVSSLATATADCCCPLPHQKKTDKSSSPFTPSTSLSRRLLGTLCLTQRRCA